MVLSMMKCLVMTMAIAVHLSVVQGWTEFGRNDGSIQRKRINGDTRMVRTVSTSLILDEKFEDIIDARSMLELSMSLSMSMSMGPPSPLPPSGPPGPMAPTAPSPPTMPTISYEPTITDEPTVPVAPTKSPTVEPVEEPTASFEPSTTTSPSTAATDPGAGGDCPGNGLSLGLPTDNSTTPLFLAVGYRAESTSDDAEDFVQELETMLLNEAASAIVDCQVDSRGLVFPQTLEVATCDPIVDGAGGCFIMETEAILFINGDPDPDVALFEAYTAIKEYIDSYTPGLIDPILSLTYLSPLPIPTPPESDDDTSEPITSRNSDGGANPIIIGASVGVVMIGVIFILFNRIRARRSRRGGGLMDETIG